MKRRVLLVQQAIEPPSGAAGVAAWMVQALRPDHAVTLLAWRAPDLAAVNFFFGTHLAPGDLTVRLAPAPLRILLERLSLTLPLYLLRHLVLLALARRLAPAFDVIVTADDEADFGPRGVHYVHYPWDVMPRPETEARWYHPRALVAVYRALCIRLSGFSIERLRQSVTLVNSDWTGRLVAARYGVTPRTLYPPVIGDFPPVPWESRESAFVCVGRIAPEKDLDRVIDILVRVRAAVPGVGLCIVGTPEGAYAERIAARARAEGDWITFRSGLSRDALAQLMAGRRYGIHGNRNEHFGMVVAEMLRAGCIVWVPNSGGQVEIVGDPRLRYDTVDEAAASIVRTLSDPGEQADLRAHLALQAKRFAADRFVREFREVIAAAAAR